MFVRIFGHGFVKCLAKIIGLLLRSLTLNGHGCERMLRRLQSPLLARNRTAATARAAVAGARPASKSVAEVDGQRGVVNRGGPPPGVQAPPALRA